MLELFFVVVFFLMKNLSIRSVKCDSQFEKNFKFLKIAISSPIFKDLMSCLRSRLPSFGKTNIPAY